MQRQLWIHEQKPNHQATDLTEVTVVIPCYNSSATIAAAVTSALAQTIPVDVIVVDDGSSDDTVSKARELANANNRLTLLVQPGNQGPSAARNRAIAAAKTSWIAILDADDYMHPDRIRRLLEAARRFNLDFVADDLIRVSPGLAPETGTRLWSDNPIGMLKLDLARFARENIATRTGMRRELGFIKPLIRMEFLAEKAIRYNEQMRLGEDYDLYARALQAGAHFAIIDPCGYYSVDYPNSLSRSYGANQIRHLVNTDQMILQDANLSKQARAAVQEHKSFVLKDWAWVSMIEAVRTRNPLGMARSLATPPMVSWTTAIRCVRHVMGKTPIDDILINAPQAQLVETLLGHALPADRSHT